MTICLQVRSPQTIFACSFNAQTDSYHKTKGQFCTEEICEGFLVHFAFTEFQTAKSIFQITPHVHSAILQVLIIKVPSQKKPQKTRQMQLRLNKPTRGVKLRNA